MSDRPDNAVILAAGFSSRFVPICFDIPKGLIPLRGETIIERQIRQLKEVGIFDITIVTGALADKFDFLREKHGARTVFNPDYATKNNFASIYAARDYLGDTVISSSDLFFPRNVFQTTAEHAYYASVYSSAPTKQRALVLDHEGKIIETKYGGSKTWITYGGQARFSAEVSRKMIEFMRPVYDDPAYANKYWVDFHDEHLTEMPMYIKRLEATDIVEFNSLDALRAFDPNLRLVNVSPTMRKLCEKHGCEEFELSSFMPIKRGNLSVGCHYVYNNNTFEYVI